MRRNARLEQHRDRCVDLKRKRAEAGKRAVDAREAAKRAAEAARAADATNGQQTASKTSTNDQQTINKRSAIDNHPTSTSTSTSLREDLNTHTHTADEFRKPGWAADEWGRFVDAWNSTARAKPWTTLTAPAAWVEHAASPGWLERAGEAMAHLPACEFFVDPLAVTKFFGFVDRILAGEFDHKKQQPGRVRQTIGGNL